MEKWQKKESKFGLPGVAAWGGDRAGGDQRVCVRVALVPSLGWHEFHLQWEGNLYPASLQRVGSFFCICCCWIAFSSK